MMSFQVIEDNGGGTHLFVFDTFGNAVWGHTGYEFSEQDLRDDIKALLKGADPVEDEWPENLDGWTAQQAYGQLSPTCTSAEVGACESRLPLRSLCIVGRS